MPIARLLQRGVASIRPIGRLTGRVDSMPEDDCHAGMSAGLTTDTKAARLEQ